MAIQSIQSVSCGLNLGLIYSLSYSYSPENGVGITVFFVNENGQYNQPKLLPLRKTSITIGPASFSVYPVASSIEKSANHRIMRVEFVDEMFLLDNYYIALPGRGCGKNVYTLGSPVDNRSLSEKMNTAIDSVAQQIKELTQFPDYEYTFNDFLTVLRGKFSVSAPGVFGSTIKQAFTGSFRAVLDAWCQFYNLAFFFENGTIKIFDPTTLNINLPSKPATAISYTISQDIRSTYGKTACNWFQQEGDQYSLSQTNNNNGPLYMRSNTLFPVGYEFGLAQTAIDLNQVIAAMYGQNFWFLYNYSKGSTATECGWQPIALNDIPASTIKNSISSHDGLFAKFDETLFNEKFEAYRQYGAEIAGRWYLSNEMSEVSTDKIFTWFDETSGGIFNFDDVEDKAIKLDFLTPTNALPNAITETIVNKYFPGVNYVGNRVVYRDDRKIDFNTAFAYSDTSATNTSIANTVDQVYQSFFKIQGSESMDFVGLNAERYLGYIPGTLPALVTNIFAGFESKKDLFLPRFTSIPIKGISNSDYTSLKSSQDEPEDIKIVNGTSGPNVISNTSVIKTAQKGNYTVYYDKYSDCKSASSSDGYFGFRFEPNQISADNRIGITFTKQAGNAYQLLRDYGIINSLVNNPYLSSLAQPRNFATQEVSFSLNYFYAIPVNFLSNGLVGMEMNVGDNGISASYSFSNSVLQVRTQAKEAIDYEQNIRNSWIRSYRPDETIT